MRRKVINTPLSGVTKAQLTRMVKLGKCDQTIGIAYGVTRQAVHQRRVYFGIPARTEANVERNKKVCKMWCVGRVSAKDIAEKFKVSISQTYRIVTGG